MAVRSLATPDAGAGHRADGMLSGVGHGGAGTNSDPVTGSRSGSVPADDRVSFWLLVPFAVGGAIWLRRRRGRVWSLLAPVGLVLGAAAVFYGTPRFRAPVEPTVVVLATVGACALAARRWPAARPDIPSGSARPLETG